MSEKKPKNVPKKDRTNFAKDKTSMHKPEPKKMQVYDHLNKLFGLDK